jgi:hypothetical protein
MLYLKGGVLDTKDDLPLPRQSKLGSLRDAICLQA